MIEMIYNSVFNENITLMKGLRYTIVDCSMRAVSSSAEITFGFKFRCLRFSILRIFLAFCCTCLIFVLFSNGCISFMRCGFLLLGLSLGLGSLGLQHSNLLVITVLHRLHHGLVVCFLGRSFLGSILLAIFLSLLGGILSTFLAHGFLMGFLGLGLLLGILALGLLLLGLSLGLGSL